jgi:hypothetical protein
MEARVASLRSHIRAHEQAFVADFEEFIALTSLYLIEISTMRAGKAVAT